MKSSHAILLIWISLILCINVNAQTFINQTPIEQKQIENFIKQHYPQENAVRYIFSLQKEIKSTDLLACNDSSIQIAPGHPSLGRTKIIMQCIENKKNIYYLVNIQKFANVLVSLHALTIDTPINLQQITIKEMDITQQRGTPLINLSQLEKQVPAKNIVAGEILSLEKFRTAYLIRVGEVIKLDYQGNGFNIQVDAKALTSGGDGEKIRLQTMQGKILQAVVKGQKHAIYIE